MTNKIIKKNKPWLVLAIIFLSISFSFLSTIENVWAADPGPDNENIYYTSPTGAFPASNNSGSNLGRIDNLGKLVSRLSSIGDVVIYLLISLAVVYIVWNIVQYFIKGNADEGVRKAAGMNILWGIVGLAIIMSLWGLVNLVLNTFNVNPNVPVENIPKATFTS